jgi:hypothetical protein
VTIGSDPVIAAERAESPPRPFAPVWASPRWLACAGWLWFGCAAVYFLTAPGRIDIIDGGIRYEVTQSLIDLGVPAVRDPWFPGVPGRLGLRYAWYELGTSVTALPLVVIGGRLGHGSLESKQFAFSLTSVPFAAGAIALLFLIYGRLGCPLVQSLNWSLAAAFCTLLWPYAGSSFDVALQAFWLTLGVWAGVEAFAGRSKGWAVTSGAAFAMLINIQEAYLVLVASLLAVFPFRLHAVRERLNGELMRIVGLGLVAGLAIVFWANAVRFGNPLDTGRMSTGAPLIGNPLIGLAGLFVSPAKSIFLYSPTCLLALLGLRRLMRHDPQRLAPITACLVIHVALVSSLSPWAGEWAWGPRYLVASLPLACVGLPFAFAGKGRDRLSVPLCALGLVVQLLAISVDHQRYYFERSLPPFFWYDNSAMYRDSPLFARPFELMDVLRGRDLGGVRALVPGPRPFSMTASIFGPPPGRPVKVPDWMREYLVFLVPRPWTLWSRFLPDEQRPGPTGIMTLLGWVAAVAAAGSLFRISRSPPPPT